MVSARIFQGHNPLFFNFVIIGCHIIIKKGKKKKIKHKEQQKHNY
jgi:hypothetical protein